MREAIVIVAVSGGVIIEVYPRVVPDTMLVSVEANFEEDSEEVE
jgi:hypothetical protein